MKLVQKGLLVFVVLVLFQIGLFAALYDQQVHLMSNEAEARHSLLANQTLSNVLRSSVGLLDLVRETDRQVVTATMIDSCKTALSQLNALRKVYKDEASKLPIIDEARIGAERCTGLFETALRQSQTGNVALVELGETFVKLKKVGADLVLDIDSLVGLMSDEQTATTRAIASQQVNRQVTFQLLGFGTMAEIIFMALFFGWFKQDTETRFNRLMENSELLVQRKPLLPLMASKDEIAEIDLSLHQVSAALKESHEREQATIEHARDMICRIDADLSIAQSNQAVLDLLNYKVHQFVGKELKEILHKDDAERVVNYLRQNRAESELPFEARLVTRDGRNVDSLWSVRWSNRDRSFICVVHDISAQKQAERFRQEVVQMVSHDLKTPLFTVSTFLEMAESGRFGHLDQEAEETISHAFQGCDQMLALIQDLLEIERIKAGMLTLEPYEESLWAIMQSVAEPIKHLARQHEVTWQLEEPDIFVFADPDRLAQVLKKLLTRAISSSPRGTTVTVRGTGDGQFSQIDIIDGGSEPEAEALRSMFSGFQNFDAAQGGKRALELPVAQALVELHGGTVQAFREGSSCRLTLRLPSKKNAATSG